MSEGESEVFTAAERERLCLNPQCVEHGTGGEECNLPRTKAEAQSDNGGTESAATMTVGQPKTATASVVRSDGENE